MQRPARTVLEGLLASLIALAAIATPAGAQSSSANAVSTSAQSTDQASQPAPAPVPPGPKKVWTNDDMLDLRLSSPISTASKPYVRPQRDAARPANPNGKNAGWYRTRITQLQAQLPPLDDKIAQLQAALSGQTVNEVRKWGGARPDDWRVELDGLQKKRDGVAAQIDTLRDQARHDGVAPNTLP
ncbi:MAG TPA: hypothetical protein VMB02_10925 [Candidatus Aquilonibacter sp.]|nr:hypothetical protein [Candidatus Aquilonibacter sp.]